MIIYIYILYFSSADWAAAREMEKRAMDEDSELNTEKEDQPRKRRRPERFGDGSSVQPALTKETPRLPKKTSPVSSAVISIGEPFPSTSREGEEITTIDEIITELNNPKKQPKTMQLPTALPESQISMFDEESGTTFFIIFLIHE